MSKLGYCIDFLRSNKQSSETLAGVIYKLTYTAGEKEGETGLYMHLGIDLWKEDKRWRLRIYKI